MAAMPLSPESSVCLGAVTTIVGIFFFVGGWKDDTKFAYTTVLTRYFALFLFTFLWYLGKIPFIVAMATYIDFVSGSLTLYLLLKEERAPNEAKKTE